MPFLAYCSPSSPITCHFWLIALYAALSPVLRGASDQEEKGFRSHTGKAIRRAPEKPRLLRGARFTGGTPNFNLRQFPDASNKFPDMRI